jgi:hypothetical protein
VPRSLELNVNVFRAGTLPLIDPPPRFPSAGDLPRGITARFSLLIPTLHTMVLVSGARASAGGWCYDHRREKPTCRLHQAEVDSGGKKGDHFLLYRTRTTGDRAGGQEPTGQYEQLHCTRSTEGSAARTPSQLRRRYSITYKTALLQLRLDICCQCIIIIMYSYNVYVKGGL